MASDMKGKLNRMLVEYKLHPTRVQRVICEK